MVVVETPGIIDLGKAKEHPHEIGLTLEQQTDKDSRAVQIFIGSFGGIRPDIRKPPGWRHSSFGKPVAFGTCLFPFHPPSDSASSVKRPKLHCHLVWANGVCASVENGR